MVWRLWFAVMGTFENEKHTSAERHAPEAGSAAPSAGRVARFSRRSALAVLGGLAVSAATPRAASADSSPTRSTASTDTGATPSGSAAAPSQSGPPTVGGSPRIPSQRLAPSLVRPAAGDSVPAIFFSPHQDDEVLQMGVEIVRHVGAGRPVTVIGVGDGTASRALDVLNGHAACGFHGYRHAVSDMPLTAAEMGAARTSEQVSAVSALGVVEYVPGVYPEAQLSVAVWREVLLEHEHRVAAGGSVFVPTPWETWGGRGNPDHGNGGVAMRQLLIEGHYSSAAVRYTVFSRYWSTAGCPPGTTRGPASAAEKARLRAAAEAYRAWSPAAGSYGIGWAHSAPADFAAGFQNTGARYLMQRYHQ